MKKKKILKLKFITIIVILYFVAKRIDEENKKEHGSRTQIYPTFGFKWHSIPPSQSIHICVPRSRSVGLALIEGEEEGGKGQGTAWPVSDGGRF